MIFQQLSRNQVSYMQLRFLISFNFWCPTKSVLITVHDEAHHEEFADIVFMGFIAVTHDTD